LVAPYIESGLKADGDVTYRGVLGIVGPKVPML
jgi:hypothetical protein